MQLATNDRAHRGAKGKVWDEFLEQQRKNAATSLKVSH